MSWFFAYSTVPVLRVTGSDAQTYLQSQCTADLRRPGPQEVLWLNRKGRILAQTTLFPEADGSWLVTCAHLASPALQELVLANVIADDVEVSDETAAWQCGILWGQPSAPAVAGIKLCPTPRWGVSAWEVLAPLGWVMPWTQAKVSELAAMRIQHGVPQVPMDAGAQDFPQEAGLDALVSYTKGCYLGQEVMARIHAMGSLRRVLRRIQAEGVLQSGTPLMQGDKTVGEVRSVFGQQGLAMVSVACVEGAVLTATGGPVTLGVAARYELLG